MLVEHRTVAKETEITLIEKKSKFIARIKPVKTVEMAEEFIDKIRKEHWNATHNVPAYIIGMNQEIQKYSDDNEPSGTAGLPMLEILKGNELVNVVVVVTRYFGGTLLGRGGLIRAYGGATREAVKSAGIVKMVPARRTAITVDYVHSGKIENELIIRGIVQEETEYLEKVTYNVLLFADEVDSLKQAIQEFTANEFTWSEGNQVYRSVPLESENDDNL
ncbi:MAG TPA: YigZ family protein [Natronincola sp.]|nr:YigZ family protein [Natronincola sp.]